MLYKETAPTAVIYDGKTPLVIVANPTVADRILAQCEEHDFSFIGNWWDWQVDMETNGEDEENPEYLLSECSVYIDMRY